MAIKRRWCARLSPHCATFYVFPQTHLVVINTTLCMDHWTFNPPNHLITAQIRLAFDVSYDLGTVYCMSMIHRRGVLNNRKMVR